MRYILLFFLIFTKYALYAQDEDPTSDELFSVIDTTKELFEYNLKQLDDYFSSRQQSGKFNGNVLIAQKGKPIFSKAYGFANRDTWEKLNINSTFQLASTSKPFTSTAILMLADKGKLKLDDTLQTYFPDFPYKGITVRMLLCHRSGLPDYLVFSQKYFAEKKYLDNWDVFYMMECNKPKPVAPPNTSFDYNNTNYVLLAALVEKVSGIRFDKFLEYNIFKPLGMKNTWVWHPTQSRKKGQTYGYSYSWKKRDPDMFDGAWGDKGIYSNVEDMLKWDQSFYTNLLLSPKMIKEAFASNNITSSRKNYGLGWRTYSTDDGSKIVYHNGWWHDYNIVFKRYLKDTTTIIIMSNKYNQSVYKTDPVLGLLNNKKLPVKDTIPILKDSLGQYPGNKYDSIWAKTNQKDSIKSNPIPVKKDSIPIKNNSITKVDTILSKNTTPPKPPVKKPLPPPKPKFPLTHIVKKGDTLYSLSKKYGCNIEEIKKWNKLSSPDIKMGQKLIIKQGKL